MVQCPAMDLRLAPLFALALVAACGGQTDTEAPPQVIADAGAADDAPPDAGTGSCCVIDGSAYCEPAYALADVDHPLVSYTQPCETAWPCLAYTPMMGLPTPSPGVWTILGSGACEP
jgi:hypothetical protein